MKRVGVLIDFSLVSEVALQHACLLSTEWISNLILIHICEIGQKSKALLQLESFKDRFNQNDIAFDTWVDEGEFFETIPATLEKLALDVVVVGTHGIKGISDPKYGLNIIRLIDSVKIPFLIVQDHSQPPEEGFDEILLSVLPSHNLESNEPFLADFVSSLKAHFIVLAILNHESEKTATEQSYKALFSKIAAQLTYDYDLLDDLVGGFGKSILQYASIENAKIIAISRKHEAKNLKEDDFRHILLNRQGFAILVLS